MQWASKLFPLHIFPKVVLTFLVALVPLFAISLAMNRSGSATVKAEISSSLESRVELYMNILEFNFKRIIELEQEYLNDDDLQKLSTSISIMSNIDIRDSIIALKRNLDLMKDTNPFVQEVTALIPLFGQSISSSSHMVADFDTPMFQALTSPSADLLTPFQMWNGNLYITTSHPEAAARSIGPPLYLLAARVSNESIRNMLQQFTRNFSGSILVSNSYQWQVATGDDRLATEITTADRVPQKVTSDLPSDQGSSGDVRTVTVGHRSYIVVSRFSDTLGMTLFMYAVRDAIYGPINAYRAWLWALSMISAVLIFLFSYSIYRMIHMPLFALIRSFREVEAGNLSLALSYRLRDEFGYLYDQFNSMVRRLNVLVHEVYEQKYRAQLSELRHLQSQINPHFLYNNFYLLHRMAVLKDNENITRFTKYLGDYFQFITRDGTDEVTLGVEVRHARTYAEIQTFRFGDRIRVEFDSLPEAYSRLVVPRLILQPVVENAYNHGLANKVRDGLIRVGIGEETDAVVVTVEDNGTAPEVSVLEELRRKLESTDLSEESTGLINVHRRLRIKLGEAAGLRLGVSTLGGLRVEIVLGGL